MSTRFPGYDVLAKRTSISWNDATRRTIDARLATPGGPRFFTELQQHTLCAVCDRIIPQPAGREPVALAAQLDARMLSGRTDGFRRTGLPPMGEAWRRALDALQAEALERCGGSFHELEIPEQIDLLQQMQAGHLSAAAWQGMSSQEFFAHRLLLDIVSLYYAQPCAWNDIGFGGPASPRGYVRMDFDRRDPWEAAEARGGTESAALRDNRRAR